MPTFWRSLRRSVAGSFTVTPSTTMVPPCTGSRPLMQRSSVLLPEPDRPMMAMISPGSIEIETSSRTVWSPKRLTTLRISTSDMESALEEAAPLRQREADREIERRHRDVDRERLEGRSGRELAFAGQLDEADRRRERRVLDELDEEADGRRDRDADRLRDDDPAQLLAEAEAERAARLPLGARDRFQRAAPDLPKEGAGVDREGEGRRDPGQHRQAEDREAEEEHEKDHQQRRPLDCLDVENREPAQRREARHAHHCDDEAEQRAADEAREGERHCPAQRPGKVEKVDGAELPDHRNAKA